MESNHHPFQSGAVFEAVYAPCNLSSNMVEWTGLEPAVRPVPTSPLMRTLYPPTLLDNSGAGITA